MTRTTIDIDPGLLRRLNERTRREGKTIGQLVSELLAAALDLTEASSPGPRWRSRSMTARVDLADKEAVRRAVDAR